MFERLRCAYASLLVTISPDATKMLKQAQQITFPDIGNPAKVYPVTLTEPEINSIHAASGLLEAFCRGSGLTNFWDHYGPTLEALSKRLAVFDD